MQGQRFRRQTPPSRLKPGEGQIVHVQGGGRILRSIGKKDGHSKVCTARGPRDRRLRLSATTAIRFYDVQDRLGHGRPSDAIDWLMKEAKPAIDALHEFPPAARKSGQDLQEQSRIKDENQIHPSTNVDTFLLQNHLSVISSSEPDLFPASDSLNFETTPTTNWFNPETAEIGQSQRVMNWASNSNSDNGEEREGGLAIDSLPRWLLGQDHVFSQGGTLQSSYSPSFRALMNSPLSDLNYDQVAEVNPSPATGNSFAGDGFSGFFGSPRVQGEEAKGNPVPNKPASASCILHYQD
ncbi:hypothetical protein U1Q18_010539 [Sarracenia purpurea var. burkii]